MALYLYFNLIFHFVSFSLLICFFLCLCFVLYLTNIYVCLYFIPLCVLDFGCNSGMLSLFIEKSSLTLWVRSIVDASSRLFLSLCDGLYKILILLTLPRCAALPSEPHNVFQLTLFEIERGPQLSRFNIEFYADHVLQDSLCQFKLFFFHLFFLHFLLFHILHPLFLSFI